MEDSKENIHVDIGAERVNKPVEVFLSYIPGKHSVSQSRTILCQNHIPFDAIGLH